MTAGASRVALVVAVLAGGVFTFRLSVIGLYARVDDLPPRARTALAFVPASVLAAFVCSAVFGPLVSGGPLLDPRLPAVVVAAAVAWRTKSMVAAIAVGMAVRWGVGFVVGRARPQSP